MHPVYSLRRFVHPHADLGVVCRSALRHVSAGVLHHVHDSRQSPCSTTPQLVLSLPSEMLGTPLSHLHAQFGPKSLSHPSAVSHLTEASPTLGSAQTSVQLDAALSAHGARTFSAEGWLPSTLQIGYSKPDIMIIMISINLNSKRQPRRREVESGEVGPLLGLATSRVA